MPADRTLAEGLADALVELYGNAAVRIADDMARRLKTGIDSPSWAADKLGSINDLRNAVRQVIDKLHADGTGLADQAVTLAFARGGKAAMDELAKSGFLTAEQLAAIRHSLGATEAVNRLAYTLVSTLRGTHLRILRWSLDSYREVVAKAAPAVLLGTKSRLAAAQTAWDELLSRGVTGFVDKSGRRWQLASYVEMATRTTVAQAAIEGHSDKLNDAGIDLRMISNAPQECVKCRPWEGKVLATSGPPGKRTIRRQSPVSDEWIDVHIAGTMDEAIARGLFHPNCRHSSNAYLPGATKPIEHTEDPEGDAARQQLRALERKVRENKLQAQAALDPAARKQFEAKVRDYQRQIKDHVADTSVTVLNRQRHREQIGAGNIPPKARGARTRKPREDQAAEHVTPPGEPAKPPTLPAVESKQPRPADMTDDELDTAFNAAVNAADDERLDELLAEMDRRQAVADAQARAAAERAEQTLADEAAARRAAAEQEQGDVDLDPGQAAQWAKFDELLTQGYDEESAVAEVFGRSAEQQRRDHAIGQLRDQGYTGRGFDELARKAFKDYVYQQYIAAEGATRGHMVTPAGQAAGIDPHDLFSGPAARARKWASDELKEWWDIHGRLTYADWVALLLGKGPGFGGTAGDAWLR